jgi:AraC-like DNA-binding protein
MGRGVSCLRLRSEFEAIAGVVPCRLVSGAERIGHLRAARDLMDLRFSDPLDLDQMAAQAGFSKFHFARAFKDAYGETPANYLSRRRVERAKDLLRSANLTVTEVCMLVGFSSLGSFSSRFSEMVGMPPSAFQRASVARGGPPPIPGCFLMDWARPRPAGSPAEERNRGEA